MQVFLVYSSFFILSFRQMALQHFALMIDGAPDRHLSGDLDAYLVEGSATVGMHKTLTRMPLGRWAETPNKLSARLAIPVS